MGVLPFLTTFAIEKLLSQTKNFYCVMKKSNILSLLFLFWIYFGFQNVALATTVNQQDCSPAVVPIDPLTDKPKVQVSFYAPGIVRVTKYPANLQEMPSKESFTVIMKPETVDIMTHHEGDCIIYESSALRVCHNRKLGTIVFLTLTGDTLLSEESEAHLMPITEGADKGRIEIAQTWRLGEKEPLFGLGQRKDADLNVRGKHVKLWNVNTYIPLPFIISPKGWGLFWDNMSRSFFDDDPILGTSFRSEVADMVDYYFLYRDGTTDGVVASIRQLTGQATMFPLWAMGYWQCRERYKTSDQLASVLDRYRSLKIPLDAIVQDWQYWGCDSNWNAMRFMNPYYINRVGDSSWAKYLPADMRNLPMQGEPRLKSPNEMVKYVHQNNAHLMITIWPDFGPWTEQYGKLKSIGALLPFNTWPTNSGAMPYDPFNPKARDIYWNYLSHLYEMGFDAWWTDSTEPDHFEKAGDDAYETAAGTWRSVKNAYALVHNRGIYEHQRALKGNQKRSLQMTRSGQIGIQHYGTFSWSGDIVSTWDEMRRQVPSGLNYVICGIPFWNTDIGGFFGGHFKNDPHNPAMQELQVRWMQWGTFLPLMRNHCSSPMVSEIYEFGQPGEWAYDCQAEAIRLRYRLLPYIYSMQGEVVLHDGSMMRPLVMDFANDEKALTLNDEYMFGRSLLVKPITEPLYTWRDEQGGGHQIYPDLSQASAPMSIYLPHGCDWYDFYTNQRFTGGKQVLRPCPITEIPVYVRAGSILPWGPEVQYSSEKSWDNLEIRIFAGADGTFTLYEDRGDGYEYEKGQYSLIPFSWNEQSQTLTIGKRIGSYPNMLKSRQFRISLIGNSKEIKTVQYSGKEVVVNL